MTFFERVRDLLLYPSNVKQLTAFYFAWIAIYLAANLTWDILSPNTPPFHLWRLRFKYDALFNAGTLASGVLVIMSGFDDDVRRSLATVPCRFRLPAWRA